MTESRHGLLLGNQVAGKFNFILFGFECAVQFGIQPILTRNYTPPQIIRSTVILMQEIVKFFMAFFMLRISSSGSTTSAIQGTILPLRARDFSPCLIARWLY